MPEQSHRQLAELGVPVDTPYRLTDEQTIDHLARIIASYDVVIASQAVPFVHPALQRLGRRPAFVEHGGLVREALSGDKSLTDRYVGVCASIRDAAAAGMADRPHHALEIPSVVDLGEFDRGHRPAVRREWGVADDAPVVGVVGRLDRKKRVEDVLAAAALLASHHPQLAWVIAGRAELPLSGARRLPAPARRGPGRRRPGPLAGRPARRAPPAHRVRHAGVALGGRRHAARPRRGRGRRATGRGHLRQRLGPADHRRPQRDLRPAPGSGCRRRHGPAAGARPGAAPRLGDELRRIVEQRYSLPAVLPLWRSVLDELVAP